MKNKKNRSSVGIFVISFLIGVAIGVISVSVRQTRDDLSSLFIFWAAVFVSCYIHVILHEAGHLVFGLMTGYKFSSFRVGSLMLIKQDGVMRLKKTSLAGTGGQCLLYPPDMIDGKIPYVLYNLGGVFVNIIVALIALAVVFCTNNSYVADCCIAFSLAGFGMAALNGIPMKNSTICNDGSNTLTISRSPSSLKAFWIQLKVSELISKGMRLKDMPSELFELGESSDLNNNMVSAVAVFNENRLMDEHRFIEANNALDRLLDGDAELVGIYRFLLSCDRLYIELLNERRAERINAIYDKQMAAFMKKMKLFPSVLRTRYAYALLFENDSQKADEILFKFDGIADSYPYPSDIESERELIDIAYNQATDVSRL